MRKRSYPLAVVIRDKRQSENEFFDITPQGGVPFFIKLPLPLLRSVMVVEVDDTR